MKWTIRTAIIMAVTLVVAMVTGLAALGGWPSDTTAQIIDVNECQKACYAQESACTLACKADVNPMECDGRCRHRRQDCLRECHHQRTAPKDEPENSRRPETGR